MNQNQVLVIQWWHISRNYNTGIMLFSQFSKNKILARSLAHKHEKFGRRKLEYELPKSVGLNFRDMPKLSTILDLIPNNPLQINDTEKTDDLIPIKSELSDEENSEENSDEYPKIIRRIKYEYSELYKKRSIAHKKLLSIDSANTPKNNEARKKLLEDIKQISARMDFVYEHIDQFEKNNILPEEVIVFPGNKTVKTIITIPVLKAKRKQLIRANYKDKNKLLYQSRYKQTTEDIMPDGPKRDKVELRMKKRTTEIEVIESQILNLENAVDSK